MKDDDRKNWKWFSQPRTAGGLVNVGVGGSATQQITKPARGTLTSAQQGGQGPQGSQGSQGEQGDQGSQGEQGAQGDQGNQGNQGSQGGEGSQGNQGSQGPQGDQGGQGSQGPQGDQGQQGPQGADSTVEGPQGPVGDTGPQGPKGGDSIITNRFGTRSTGICEGTEGQWFDVVPHGAALDPWFEECLVHPVRFTSQCGQFDLVVGTPKHCRNWRMPRRTPEEGRRVMRMWQHLREGTLLEGLSA